MRAWLRLFPCRSVWLDVDMGDRGTAAMQEGAENSSAFVAVVTGPCASSRIGCESEAHDRTAIELPGRQAELAVALKAAAAPAVFEALRASRHKFSAALTAVRRGADGLLELQGYRCTLSRAQTALGLPGGVHGLAEESSELRLNHECEGFVSQLEAAIPQVF